MDIRVQRELMIDVINKDATANDFSDNRIPDNSFIATE